MGRQWLLGAVGMLGVVLLGTVLVAMGWTGGLLWEALVGLEVGDALLPARGGRLLKASILAS